MRSLLRFAVLLVAVAPNLACVNLAEIRAFADTSSQSAQYTELVDDYVDAALRSKPFAPEGTGSAFDDIAKERLAQKPKLIALHKGIAGYMDAMGKLAADELTSFDKELDGFGKALTSGDILDDDQVKAYGGLAKLVAKAFTDGWRRAELEKMIEGGHAPFMVVIGKLRTFVVRGIIGALEEERQWVTDAYDRMNFTDEGLKTLARIQKADRLAVIDNRIKAANKYAELLGKIGKGHEELHAKKANLEADDLLNTIFGYAQEIATVFGQIKNLGD